MPVATKQLLISLDGLERSALAKLGYRSKTTAKMLAAHAVRQVLATAHHDATLALPVLDAAERPKPGSGVAVTLQTNEAAALDALARCLNVTSEALGRAAVLAMLQAASSGAVPMVKAVTITDPTDPPVGSEDGRASCNFTKAKLTVEKLTMLAELGADPAKPRAHIDFMATLDELQNFAPD